MSAVSSPLHLLFMSVLPLNEGRTLTRRTLDPIQLGQTKLLDGVEAGNVPIEGGPETFKGDDGPDGPVQVPVQQRDALRPAAGVAPSW
jgi:hypothetical protein